MLGRAFLNAPADLVAAGEQDHVDIRVIDQGLACHGVSMNQVEHAGREAGFQEQLDQALADGRGILGRFEDGRVAFEQAGAEHPQGHGKGEVPGRDDGDHAPGLAAHEGVFFWDLRGQHVADRHPAGAEDVLDHVQAFDDLGPALGDDLAALPGHQPGQLIGVALDELGQVVEQLGPVNPAGASPGRKGGAGGGDGLAGLLGRATGELTHDLVIAGGVVVGKMAAQGRLPVAGNQVLALNRKGSGGGHGESLLV